MLYKKIGGDKNYPIISTQLLITITTVKTGPSMLLEINDLENHIHLQIDTIQNKLRDYYKLLTHCDT